MESKADGNRIAETARLEAEIERLRGALVEKTHCRSCKGKGRTYPTINGAQADTLCTTCCGDGMDADVRALLGKKRPTHPNPLAEEIIRDLEARTALAADTGEG